MRARRPLDVADFVLIGNATDSFLADLEREALARAERVAPLRGRIRPEQQPWAETVDEIESQRQAGPDR